MNSQNRKRRVHGLQMQLEAIRVRRESLIKALESATTADDKESIQKLWDLSMQEQTAVERALVLLDE